MSAAYKAIAAMALNGVIGRGQSIPWHLPEDFKWFKSKTTGHILVMGRKTYESIGKPLPNRTTYVLSRSGITIPGVHVITDLCQIPSDQDGRDIFICGGAQIYAQTLPVCSDLFLTVVKRSVDGDVFFPEFRDQFILKNEIMDRPEFKIVHYQNRCMP